jgi:bifunctional non-homologous end joining protein LigD
VTTTASRSSNGCGASLRVGTSSSAPFDLLELNGKDLRREPLEVRKTTLASLLRARLPGLQFNQHLEHPGDVVFSHACAMGLEGIVSKRLGSRYRSGRTTDWLKFKTRTRRR